MARIIQSKVAINPESGYKESLSEALASAVLDGRSPVLRLKNFFVTRLKAEHSQHPKSRQHFTGPRNQKSYRGLDARCVRNISRSIIDSDHKESECFH